MYTHARTHTHVRKTNTGSVSHSERTSPRFALFFLFFPPFLPSSRSEPCDPLLPSSRPPPWDWFQERGFRGFLRPAPGPGRPRVFTMNAAPLRNRHASFSRYHTSRFIHRLAKFPQLRDARRDIRALRSAALKCRFRLIATHAYRPCAPRPIRGSNSVDKIVLSLQFANVFRILPLALSLFLTLSSKSM